MDKKGKNAVRPLLKVPIFILLTVCILFFLPLQAEAQDTREQEIHEIYEISGAQGMYASLNDDARSLLSQAGVDSALPAEDGTEGKVFQAVSKMVQEKLGAPVKALAALLAVVLLCRLANCFENMETGSIVSLVGALACASIVAVPLANLIASVKETVESAAVFLTASVPVYTALMASSGNAAAGTSYSFLALAAGNAIPLVSSCLVIPLLQLFLALALTSCVSSTKLSKVTNSIYGFSKWLMILAVTVFSGILSVHTILNSQVDAATNKAAKLIASSAVPIVGSAFGDAVAAIQNSVQIVKSGAGAFGILAALCIFAPPAIESILWTAVCTAGQIAGDLFDTPQIGKFLGDCASASKMILAVIASTCAVCVVCAAVVLFVKGSL